jgi:hypothetical protein
MHSCEIGLRVSYVITSFSLCPTLMSYVRNEIQWPTIEDGLIYVGKYLKFRDILNSLIGTLNKILKMMTPIGIAIMRIRRCMAWTTWWWWIIMGWGGSKNEWINGLKEITTFFSPKQGYFLWVKVNYKGFPLITWNYFPFNLKPI